MSAEADNISRANKYMQRFAKEGVNNHINGENIPAMNGKTFTINRVHGYRPGITIYVKSGTTRCS